MIGWISTFIGILIWGGSAVLLSELGLGGWSILVGLIIALILGPAIDMGLRALTGHQQNTSLPYEQKTESEFSYEQQFEPKIKKIPCSKCGGLILPITAEKTGGICMPCANKKKK